MSDDQETTEVADTTADTTSVEETPTETASTEPETFDRAYVEQLRDENAKARLRAKDYEEVFGNYSQEDRNAWFELAKAYATDPADAAERFEQIAQALKAQQQAEVVANAESDEPLTRADLEARFKQEREALEQERLVLEVEAEADSLGYARDSVERDILYTIAAKLPDGDLKKADAQFKALLQKATDDFVAARKKDVEGSIQVPGANGMVPSNATDVKTFQDAMKASIERINAAEAAK